MWTLSNTISFSRVPLALAFLQENMMIRLVAIFLAMVTDMLDGYLARRRNTISKFGTVLDPLTDRFFVIFAFVILMGELGLHSWQLVAILSRDLAIVVFVGFLFFQGQLWEFRPRALFWGKVTTACQLVILVALTAKLVIPLFVYLGFFLLGGCAWAELKRSPMQVV